MKNKNYKGKASVLWMLLLVLLLSTMVQGFSGSGAGTSGDPYIITDCNEWNEITNALSSYYEVANNIDCDGVAVVSPGFTGSTFTGNVDGKDYTLSNILIDESADQTGLFGWTNNAVISNIDINNITIISTGNWAGLFSYTAGSTVISNITVTDILVNGSSNAGVLTGSILNTAKFENIVMTGVTGNSVGGIIKTYGSSSNSTNISATNVNLDSSIGGMIGTISSSATVSKSFLKGNVTTSSGQSGGFVGAVQTAGATFSECGFEGILTTAYTGGGIGGFVGDSINGKFINSYAKVTVNATASGKWRSGFCGECENSDLVNVYATGTIITPNTNNDGGLMAVGWGTENITNSFADLNWTSSTSATGGILGFYSGGYTQFANNYWNNKTGDPETDKNGGVDLASTTAIADNSSYFYDTTNEPLLSWDFTDVWFEQDSDYPCLEADPECNVQAVNLTPTVSISTPSQIVYVNNSVDINFTVTDDDSITNCTLYVNNTQKDQNVSVNNNTLTTLDTQVFPSLGNYTVQVNCTDGNTVGTDSIWISYEVVSDSISITTPYVYSTFQRHNSTTGEIKIVGTYTGMPTTIQARHNGGAWVTIDSTPSLNAYTGYINATVGNGTLEVKFSDDASVNDTVVNISVGDVYVIAGQSNAEARATKQTLNVSLPYLVTAYREDDSWIYADDPTDSDGDYGSPYPELAGYIVNNQSVPVSFITTADGSTTIDCWSKGQTCYDNMLHQIEEATYDSLKVKGMLFYQGEADSENDDVTTYYTKLTDMVDDFITDTNTATKVIVTQIWNASGTREDVDGIRQAQQNSWAVSNIGEGIKTYDLLYPNIHFSGVNLTSEMSYRWWLSIADEYYSVADYSAPYLINSDVYGGVQTTLNLTFNKAIKIEDWEGNSGTLAKGFRINASGTIYDDTDVDSTTIDGSTVTVIFNATFNTGSVLQYGSYTDASGEDSLRDATTNVPVRMIYDETLVGDINTSYLGNMLSFTSFDVTDSVYQLAQLYEFNTSASNTNFGLVTSFQIEKTLGGGASDVYARVKVDGVTQSEELIRSVAGGNEPGVSAISPVLFNVSTGSHNLTIEFYRTGAGTITVNNADVSLGRFETVAGFGGRGNYTSVNVTFTNVTDDYVFGKNISRTVNTSTYISGKFTLNASGSTDVYCRFIDGGSSSYFYVTLADSVSKRTVSMNYMTEPEAFNNEVFIECTNTNAETVTMVGGFIEADMRDNEGNYIAHSSDNFLDTYNITNPTNFTAGSNYIGGINHTVINGSNVFLSVSVSAESHSGGQTPVYYIETHPAGCSVMKERYHEGDDVGSIFFYPVCNLTTNQTYEFHLHVNVSAGETLEIYSLGMTAFENTAFDLSETDTRPPEVNITDPVNATSIQRSYTQIEFTANDVEGNLDRCIADLYYSNGTYVGELMNVASGGAYAVTWSNYIPENYILNVTCNDTLGNTAYDESNFELVNTVPTVTTVTTTPSGTVLSGSNVSFNGSCVGTDADSDTLTYEFEWWLNGNNVSTTQNYTFPVLVDGDIINLSCRTNDGYNNSAWLNSTEVDISDVIPVSYTLTTGVCPTDTTGVLTLGLVFFVSITMMFLAMAMGSPILGLLASLGFIGGSFVLAGCHYIAGMGLLATGVGALAVFIVKKF